MSLYAVVFDVTDYVGLSASTFTGNSRYLILTGITTTTSTTISPSCDGFGLLYNWYTVSGSSSIANTGWHVASKSEYENLMLLYDPAGTALSNTASNSLKESGTTYWVPGGGNNISGFNGRGSGSRGLEFLGLTGSLKLWNAEEMFGQGVTSQIISTNSYFQTSVGATVWTTDKYQGFSVRIVKDSTSLTSGQTSTYTGNDGTVYKTICIGTGATAQEWLSENLRETKYRNGVSIPEVTDPNIWTGLTTGALCAYDNNWGYVCGTSPITTTTTTTIAPTTTTTTTIIVESSSVLFNDSSTPNKVYAYYPDVPTNVQLSVPNITAWSADIAHTPNKMWLYANTFGGVDEWNITLSPFIATYNRRVINVPYSSGLVAKNDTTLIGISYPNVYEADISTSISTNTLIFNTLIGSRTVSGDIILTTTNKLIITTNAGGFAYISQYSYPDGALEVDIDITSTTSTPYGLYEYLDDIYFASGGGSLYKIDKTSPYAITSIASMPFNINGASQIPSYLTAHFALPPTTTTTTTTVTPTTTTTTTETTLPPLYEYWTTDFSSVPTGYTTDTEACNDTNLVGEVFAYNTGLTIGDVLFAAPDYVTTLSGSSIGYYSLGLTNGGPPSIFYPKYVVQVDGNGIILSLSICSNFTTTTTTN